MNKKVLITGVNGFLGFALWQYLNTKYSRVKVFGIDIKPRLSSRSIFLCNLNNQKQVVDLLSSIRPDTIFHLAGGRNNSNKRLLTDNVLSTRSLLESVKTLCDYSPRIIIPGSAAEYGEACSAKKPIKETVAAKPVSWYGTVKYTQTSLGLMYARMGLDVVIARIFNISGQGLPPALFLGKIAREITLIERKKKKKIIRTRSLRMKRDFLDVEDVCSALWAVARQGKAGEIYNVCSGVSYVMRDLTEQMIGYSKVKDIAIMESIAGAKDIDVSIGSNVKVKKITGWKPKVSIEKSLEQTLAHYRKSL